MCLISTPTFLASSRDASARFGHSLTARIPWSVQFSDIIKVGMETSLACVVSPTSDHALLSSQRQDRGVEPSSPSPRTRKRVINSAESKSRFRSSLRFPVKQWRFALDKKAAIIPASGYCEQKPMVEVKVNRRPPVNAHS